MKSLRELHQMSGKPFLISHNGKLDYKLANYDSAVVAITGRSESVRIIYSMDKVQDILVKWSYARDRAEAERIIRRDIVTNNGPSPVELEWWVEVKA